MTTPAPFPSVLALLVAWLPARVAGLSVATQAPADLTSRLPFVRLSRVSGTDTMRMDRPVVDVDLFASGEAAASDLGEQLRTLLRHVLPGQTISSGDAAAVIQSTSTIVGPRWLFDPDPALSRNSATYEIRLHPAPLP